MTIHRPDFTGASVVAVCGATGDLMLSEEGADCPACAEEVARRKGRSRMLSLWRGAVATTLTAEEARAEAERRTAAIDPGKAPSPALDEDAALGRERRN